MPGSPLDPHSTGTNKSPQAGCLPCDQRPRHCRSSGAPILGRPVEPFGPELSAPEEGVSPEPLPDIAQSERGRIIGTLGPRPVDIDEVARATGMAVRKVHIVLLELDLAEKLQRHGQQLVSLSTRVERC